jgi:hypothetical protein
MAISPEAETRIDMVEFSAANSFTIRSATPAADAEF